MCGYNNPTGVAPEWSLLAGSRFSSSYRFAFAFAFSILAKPCTAQIVDSFNPSANSSVYALAFQSDGKILVGGQFTSLGGQFRFSIGRLNGDGGLDTTFAPVANNRVNAFAVDDMGRIIVAGQFTHLGGQPRRGFGRLHPDGSLDLGFNPAGSGFSPVVIECLAVQANGQILVGGFFPSLGGQFRTNIARLNSDGSLELGFNPGAIGGNPLLPPITSMAVQADGNIIVGGNFTTLGGQLRSHIGRLETDGGLDSTFNPGVNGTVDCLAVQSDGKILVGGEFTAIGGQLRSRVARLNPDGTLDGAFDPGPNSRVLSVGLQTDGKIIIAGAFSTVDGQIRNRIARLHPDGSLDSTFDLSASGTIIAIAVQSDGKVIAGGGFTTLGGQARSFIGRLINTAPAVEDFTLVGSTLTWMRDGSGPEVWSTHFEASTSNNEWFPLGAGVRITGGWQVSSVALPMNATIRGRGLVAGSYGNGSSWTVESALGPPAIVHQPVSRNDNAGTQAGFWVTAAGTPPMSYQWRKDGLELSESPSIFGSRSPSLVLSNVLGSFAGGYSVVVSNAYGSVTSIIANLSVVDPVITGQPSSRTNNAATVATFNVSASGTPPLSYRWFKGAAALSDAGTISGAQTFTLTLSNVLFPDAGEYSVVVSNSLGSVSSFAASLVVRDPVITVQPVSKAANVGEFVSLNVAAAGTMPLQHQWQKNGQDLSGQNSAWLTLTNLQGTDAGYYRVIVTNQFGSMTSTQAEVSVNLATPDSLNPVSNGWVYCCALQPDGRILTGGSDSELFGNPDSPIRRFNPDGSLDSSFSPSANRNVSCLGVQADGRILVGGAFSILGGQPRERLGRLNFDGSLDESFDSAANSEVHCMAIQADGKILVGGRFTSLAGQPRSYIGRLFPDGSLDASFNPQANDSVNSLVIQPDGKIIVGGGLISLDGQTRLALSRVNNDGTPDMTFSPQFSGPATAICLQPDGKIIVGGAFGLVSGHLRQNIVRLNPDGSVDVGFDPGVESAPSTIALQANGKIILGGSFTTLAGYARSSIGRLNHDGSLDPLFNPKAEGFDWRSVYTLTLQADGRILVGGSYSRINGQYRNHLSRLNHIEPAVATLSFDGNTATWLRGGSSPEIWRTTFDVSTNGNDWVHIGPGVRIPGGWRSPGVSLSASTLIRARGFVTDAGYYSSGWPVESFTAVDPKTTPTILVSGDSFGIVSNQFGFEVAAVVGQTVVVEVSTNLMDWSSLSTNTLNLSPIYFRDPHVAVLSQRFYRARLQE